VGRGGGSPGQIARVVDGIIMVGGDGEGILIVGCDGEGREWGIVVVVVVIVVVVVLVVLVVPKAGVPKSSTTPHHRPNPAQETRARMTPPYQ
jgi:hypothetical protein